MLCSKPWGVVWRWPGQQSAEVSSVPWAPGWARWSAAGWAWRWAAPRNGSTITCPWRRGSWVSSRPGRRKSQSDRIWSVINAQQWLIYHDWQIKLRNDSYQNKTVAESVPLDVDAIHRRRGQDATTVTLDQKSLSGFQHSQLWHLLLWRYVIQTTWCTQVDLVMNVKMMRLQCEVCDI